VYVLLAVELHVPCSGQDLVRPGYTYELEDCNQAHTPSAQSSSLVSSASNEKTHAGVELIVYLYFIHPRQEGHVGPGSERWQCSTTHIADGILRTEGPPSHDQSNLYEVRRPVHATSRLW